MPRSRLPSNSTNGRRQAHNKSCCFTSCSSEGRSMSFKDFVQHFKPCVASNTAALSNLESPMETTLLQHPASEKCVFISSMAATSFWKTRHFQRLGDCGCNRCGNEERADTTFVPSSRGQMDGRNFWQVSSTQPFSAFVTMIAIP